MHKKINITAKQSANLLFICLLCAMFFINFSCKPEKTLISHCIRSEQSSPEGTQITAWDENNKIYGTSIIGGSYEITFSSENTQEILDSIVASCDKYETLIIKNLTVSKLRILDIVLNPATFSLFGNSSTPNATGKVYDEGKELANIATDPAGKYETANMEFPADSQVDSIVVSKDGVSITYPGVYVDVGRNKFEFNINDPSYQYNINGSVASSLAGKIIKDGARVGAVLESMPNDTAWTTTANQAYAFTVMSSSKQSENYTLIFKEIAGHEDKNITGTTTGEKNIGTTELQAITYPATIPIRLVRAETGIDLEGIVVNGIGDRDTTDYTGRATLTDQEIETNQYNEPIENSRTTTLVGSIGTVQQIINYDPGQNNEQTFSVTPETVTDNIHYTVTPENATVPW